MTIRKTTLALLLAATLTPLAATNVHAQSGFGAPIQAPERVYTQAELDQMLAPIALYPDALLSQVLMAATYPIEVSEAARWTRANPGLTGDAAVRAVQNHDWDPSVISLVAFPQVLQRMDENPQWTQSLGDAFLAQEPSVMDTVQQLRRRAQAAGHLQSTEQIYVQQQGQVIVVQSPPEMVYVPYYDPMVVYGNWWWAAYRPMAWAPWPGYARPRSGVSFGLWFGSPIGVNLNFFFGDVDWGRRHVHVVRPNVHYYRPPTRITYVQRGGWQHDPHHRRGVAYRAPEVRQRFAESRVERREEQRAERRTIERTAPTPQVVNRTQVQERRQVETRTQPAQREDRRQAQEQARRERVRQERPQVEARERAQAGARERAQQAVRERTQAQPQVRQEAPRAEPRSRAEVRGRPQVQPQQRQEARQERQEQRQQQRQEPRTERGGDRGDRDKGGRRS